MTSTNIFLLTLGLVAVIAYWYTHRSRRPTFRQRKAQKEYVAMTGHKITKERMKKIRSEWK